VTVASVGPRNMALTPDLEAKARKIYWIESMGWNGPGRRRRWPEFDKLDAKDKDYWYARASIAGELSAPDRSGYGNVHVLRPDSVAMRGRA
jgi:hypothetical protein